MSDVTLTPEANNTEASTPEANNTEASTPEANNLGASTPEANTPQVTSKANTTKKESAKMDTSGKNATEMNTSEKGTNKPEINANPIESELEYLKSQVNQLAITNLMADYKVPPQLKGIIPNDLGKAREFLESEQYQRLVSDLARVAELEQQKAELQAKLESLNKPQRVDATPIPDAKTEPAKKLPAKKWDEISPESLAAIGSVLLKSL